MKKISISLNEQSIRNAILQLGSYKMQLGVKIRQATNRLMMDSQKVLEAYISAEYVHDPYDDDHSVIVTGELTDNGFVLTATGTQIGFPVFSGSYSDTVGKGTWDAWIRSGHSAEDYPYNRQPKYPLYYTSLWIRDHWADYYREAIKEIKI